MSQEGQAVTDLPPPTPAGKLLRSVRRRAVPKLSQPEVAHRAGIDPGTLGNIERGYRHLGDGRTRAVPGDPVTIAKVARILGIGPEQLEDEGKRPDAAEELREILRQHDRTAPAPSRAEDDELRQIEEFARLPPEIRRAVINLARTMRQNVNGEESA
jgi:transcriptional regulator with XRE-family HTH domain